MCLVLEHDGVACVLCLDPGLVNLHLYKSNICIWYGDPHCRDVGVGKAASPPPCRSDIWSGARGGRLIRPRCGG